MMRYYVSSLALHIALLSAFFATALFHRSNPPVFFIESFDYEGTGYGDGTGTGGGGRGDGREAGRAKERVPEEKKGQVVPEPVNVPVPEKAAPLQKATVADETWSAKKAAPLPPVPKKPDENAVKGLLTQPAASNVIRKGVAPGTETGESQFDFGGDGDGWGLGKGVGIGFGPGEGGGGIGGFGSYLKILRRRIWSEWTQSAVYGTKETAIIGMTILKDGTITDINVEKPSGNTFYDSVAMRAVRNASPLPPLPPGLGKAEQRFRIQFKLLE